MSNHIHDHDSVTRVHPDTNAIAVCWHFRHWPAHRGRPLCDCTAVCREDRLPLGMRRFDIPEAS